MERWLISRTLFSTPKPSNLRSRYSSRVPAIIDHVVLLSDIHWLIPLKPGNVVVSLWIDMLLGFGFGLQVSNLPLTPMP